MPKIDYFFTPLSRTPIWREVRWKISRKKCAPIHYVLGRRFIVRAQAVLLARSASVPPDYRAQI